MTVMELVGPTVQRIVTALPSLLFALGILVVGYVIAKVAAGFLSRALGRTNLDTRTAEAIGLTKPDAPAAVRSVVARIAFWLIMLFVWIGFFNQVGLPLVAEPLTGFGERLVGFMISVVVATAILGVGLWAGNLVQGLVGGPLARTGARHPQTIAAFAKYAVVIFAFAMALQQIGFGETTVVWAFVLLFGAICLALALAFGLGSREAAGRVVARALGEGVGSGARPGGA